MTSHSSTSRFNGCPWAYKLHKEGIHKLEVGPESNYAQLGKAIDAGLTAHYRGEDPYQAFNGVYPEDLDPTNQVWNREGGIRTIEAYINYYQTIDQQWEILGTQIQDTEEGVRPTLIIDIIAKHKQSGSIYFWDHKVKKELRRDSTRRYEIEAQISRYTAWVLEKYGDCAGAVINMIVPGYRANPYYRRGADKGTVQPAGWHFKFERQIVSRTPQQLEYWKQSQAEWELLIQHCEATNLYPKHLGWTCSGCEFYEYCISGGDQELLTTLYGIDESQPFEVVVEDEG